MKQAFTLFNWLAVCTIALATAATAQAEQRTAEVVRIKGSARYSTGNNVWQPLKVGAQLGAGAIVQTAADSIVDIVFSEATSIVRRPVFGEIISYNPTVQRDVVRMQGDSVLAIDKLTMTDTGADKITETELDLRSGKIIGAVKKVSAASTFEVKIPNGVAGIRGTWFSISALGFIQVWLGSVAIAINTPSGPKVITLGEMRQYDITTGIESDITDPRPRDLIYAPGQPTIVIGDQTVTVITGTAGSSGDSEDDGWYYDED